VKPGGAREAERIGGGREHRAARPRASTTVRALSSALSALRSPPCALRSALSLCALRGYAAAAAPAGSVRMYRRISGVAITVVSTAMYTSCVNSDFGSTPSS